MMTDTEQQHPVPKAPPTATVTVPARAQWSLCKTCHTKIYWLPTPKGRLMPVDCTVATGREPDASTGQDGLGVSHFATCAEAAAHRRTRA